MEYCDYIVHLTSRTEMFKNKTLLQQFNVHTVL